jgi:tetratricopeptide (TPR) repeat protein
VEEIAVSPAAQAPTIQEFVLDNPEDFFESPAEPAPAPPQEATITEFAVEAVAEPVTDRTQVIPIGEIEIDVSHEWESMLSGEPEPVVEEVSVQPASFEIPHPVPPSREAESFETVRIEPSSAEPEEIVIPAELEVVGETFEIVADDASPSPEPVAAGIDLALIEDKVQEIRFYISQEFWDMAQAAIHDLLELNPNNPSVDELRAAIAAGEAKAAAAMVRPPAVVQPPAAVQPPVTVQPPPPMPVAVPVVERPIVQPQPNPVPPTPLVPPSPIPVQKVSPAPSAPPVPQIVVQPPVEPVAKPAATAPPPSMPRTAAPELLQRAAPQSVDDEFVLEFDDEPAPAAPAPVAAAKPAEEPVRAVVPVAPEPKDFDADVLGDLVSELEESLGDFVPGGGGHEPQIVPAAFAAPPPITQPAAAMSAPAAQFSAPPSVTSFSAAQEAPANVPAVHVNGGGMQDAEATSVLSNIFSELQHELEEDLGDNAVEAEDPETHYNLGIAFKEMGLLDEAIGELQKVCHSVEVGSSFSQPVQAFTWLAQCLVDKGVPEAAVRWYQQALRLPGLDHISRCAIYYDLGSAYEASGDRKSALNNFMEVYSSNIDFRDVASRIKVLKS